MSAVNKITDKDFSSYLMKGWSIIPLCSPIGKGCLEHGESCNRPGKKPLISWKQYQYKRASEDMIHKWRKQWPNANWAVVTGRISGICVVDQDDPNIEIGDLGNPAIVRTSRGQHYYFRLASKRIRSTIIRKGLELQSNGKYVVLPPSRHCSGQAYEWIIPPSSVGNDLPELPEHLIPQKAEGYFNQASYRPISEIPKGLVDGERHIELTRMVGCLLGDLSTLRWPVIWQLLLCFNESRCDPPLTEKELLDIFANICQRELSKCFRCKRSQSYIKKIRSILENNNSLTYREIYRMLHGDRIRGFDRLWEMAKTN